MWEGLSMENITFEKCIFYDKSNNRTYIPESLISLKLFQQLAHSWFYNAFKSAQAHSKKTNLKVRYINKPDFPIIDQIEGFAIMFTDDSAVWLFSDNAEILDAVKFQRDVLICMESKNILGSKEMFTDYVLAFLNDYMRNPAISYDELCTIYETLNVEEFSAIKKEQIESFINEKKQLDAGAILSEEEYYSAISHAEKDFNEKGLSFYSCGKDKEVIKAFFTPEMENLIYSGTMIITFSDQESFDAFIKNCRCKHIVGVFDISPKTWKYKKYFYFNKTSGNLKLCSTNMLEGVIYDGIINGEIFNL